MTQIAKIGKDIKPPHARADRSINALMQLISDKTADNEPIKRLDIVKTYYNAFAEEGCGVRVYGTSNYLFKDCWRTGPDCKDPKYLILEDDSELLNMKALQWFKLNLGAAIIKGKLSIIPVIEID